MPRHAVMHDFILLKMPEMEPSVDMRKGQEVSGQFHNIFFHGKLFKIERADLQTESVKKSRYKQQRKDFKIDVYVEKYTNLSLERVCTYSYRCWLQKVWTACRKLRTNISYRYFSTQTMMYKLLLLLYTN